MLSESEQVVAAFFHASRAAQKRERRGAMLNQRVVDRVMVERLINQASAGALSLDIQCACGRAVPLKGVALERLIRAHGLTVYRLGQRLRCSACGDRPTVAALFERDHSGSKPLA